MKKYDIIQLCNEPYDFLIIATTYENPLNEFEAIRNEIGTKEARILFDLTLINGLKSNRYIQCLYTADDCMFRTCSLVNSIDKGIEQITCNYFKNNRELVCNSIIPNALKFLLLNG